MSEAYELRAVRKWIQRAHDLADLAGEDARVLGGIMGLVDTVRARIAELEEAGR